MFHDSNGQNLENALTNFKPNYIFRIHKSVFINPKNMQEK